MFPGRLLFRVILSVVEVIHVATSAIRREANDWMAAMTVRTSAQCLPGQHKYAGRNPRNHASAQSQHHGFPASFTLSRTFRLRNVRADSVSVQFNILQRLCPVEDVVSDMPSPVATDSQNRRPLLACEYASRQRSYPIVIQIYI